MEQEQARQPHRRGRRMVGPLVSQWWLLSPHASSVKPGQTAESNTTAATVRQTRRSGSRSGCRLSSIGVGPVMRKKVSSRRSSGSVVERTSAPAAPPALPPASHPRPGEVVRCALPRSRSRPPRRARSSRRSFGRQASRPRSILWNIVLQHHSPVDSSCDSVDEASSGAVCRRPWPPRFIFKVLSTDLGPRFQLAAVGGRVAILVGHHPKIGQIPV